jgi:hypothetical protein
LKKAMAKYQPVRTEPHIEDDTANKSELKTPEYNKPELE